MSFRDKKMSIFRNTIADFLPTPKRLKTLLKEPKRSFEKIKLIKEILEIYLGESRRCIYVPGQLSIRDAAFLYKCAKEVPENGICVEIGAFKGRSSCFIAAGLKKSAKLYSVDTFQSTAMGKMGEGETLNDFIKNTSFLRKNVIPLVGMSEEIAKNWSEEIDFLWIDGDHSYEGVKKDIEGWVKFLKSGRKVAFHDYPNAEGVRKAIDDVLRKNWKIKREGIIDLIWWAEIEK